MKHVTTIEVNTTPCVTILVKQDDNRPCNGSDSGIIMSVNLNKILIFFVAVFSKMRIYVTAFGLPILLTNLKKRAARANYT